MVICRLRIFNRLPTVAHLLAKKNHAINLVLLNNYILRQDISVKSYGDDDRYDL
jgi:hypothetical protein